MTRPLSMLALSALLFVACKEAAPESSAPMASATPRVPAPAPAPSGSAASAAASAASTLAGKWEGGFEAKPHKIELADKGANERAWAKDDGAQKSGKGTLSLVIAADGAVTGTASGALGDGDLGGAVEKELVTLSFVAKDTADPLAMTGTLVLRQVGSELQGDFHASSGDSYVVREAKVTLKKTP